MNSSRPYILRALHEWIVDNECTPHILVDVNHPQVKVPPGYAVNEQIVLNTAPAAVRYFEIDNQAVSFEALFSGAPFSLYVPIEAVLAIYARENGQGMFFDASSDELGEENEELSDEDDSEAHERPVMLHAVDSENPENKDPDPDDEPPQPPTSGRPSLRIIK
ncbi:MAG TPA: ClpXP protease specificity-enhancing factor [Gammaproteobacteria bacterium]|nr:ClpXP protease specificity-enhancing factor [Gammaproteobacteria bacterium]